MISPAIRALIQRLSLDDGFRRAFATSPDQVLAQHDFSSEERRALLRFQARLATADGPRQGAHGGELTPWP